MDPRTAALQSVLAEVGDGRMTWVSAKPRTSVVARKNLGAEKARGEWVGFLAPEDVLSPVAFFLAVLSLQSDEPCDLIYSNEAAIDRDGNKSHGVPLEARVQLVQPHPLQLYRSVLDGAALAFIELGDFDSSAEEHHEQDFLLRFPRGRRHGGFCRFFFATVEAAFWLLRLPQR